MKEVIYQTQGTCSQMIALTGDQGKVVDVKFFGGCHGNLQGIASLVAGMKYEDVIARLEGIHCGTKATSCPDQLVQAIKKLMAEGD